VDKLFALVDCNNFYVSCERVFNPAVENRPVVVLSNNDGCIIARSNEAKALGIRMGQPVFECRTLIARHGVHVYSSNYSLYGDISRRVMDMLNLFCPEVEVYSIDEAFLNLTGLPGIAREFCRPLRARIRKWVGMPVSIGIGPSKTLAKAAARVAKKDPDSQGVFDLTGRRDEVLASLDVEDVWGIGRRYARLLRRHGICTALDLSRVGDGWALKHLTVAGLRTVKELRGDSCISLEDAGQPSKTIICSRSFGRKVYRMDELQEAAAAYAARAAEKLRGQGSAASFIQVMLVEFPFNDGFPATHIASADIPVATAYTPELTGYAKELLKRIYRQGPAYRKAGVMLAGIVPRGRIQTNLFHPSREGPKQLALMEAMDGINARWGRGTVGFAASGFERPWWMRQARKSPRFTTSWADLPRVRT
jgi:DNA polymerase V